MVKIVPCVVSALFAGKGYQFDGSYGDCASRHLINRSFCHEKIFIYNDGSFEITGKTTFAMSGKATFVNLQSASLQDVTMTGSSKLINEEGTVKANSLDTRSSYIYNH